MTYYDYPALENAERALVNDLNLAVQIGGVTYFGNNNADGGEAGMRGEPSLTGRAGLDGRWLD